MLIRVLPGVLAAGLVLASPFVATDTWEVRGEAVVTCPCKTPCPCRSNAHASQPHCENLSYVHFVQGHYGATKLDGVEYVWAADECQSGPNRHTPTQLYFPKEATNEQISAVEGIMSGEHGGHEASDGVRVTRGELKARAAGALYSIEIPGLLAIQVDLMPGPLPMEPLPALDSWGNTVTYAHSDLARIDDRAAKLKWDYSGRQANYRTFETTSEALKQGLLLAEFRDDAGRFNEMQRSLIEEQHLQVPLNREEFGRMLAQVNAEKRIGRNSPGNAPYGSIGGVISGFDGRPQSGTRVHLLENDHEAVPISVANAAGRYFIARVAPGNYSFCAVSWDGVKQQQSCEPVTVTGGRVLEHNQTLSAMQR